MKKVHHKILCIAWFHLDEMSSVGKSIEMQGRLVVSYN
jgi:hypothetical protein